MTWVERLSEAVSWKPRHVEISWGEIEQQLGVELPTDFKKFCECFGRGSFSGYLEVYSSSGGASLQVLDKLASFRRLVEQHPMVRDAYEPYEIFRGCGEGVIPWGISTTASEYCWLANSTDRPDSWPIVAREDGGDWQIFEMSMSEFAYRLLADAIFEEFTIADLVPEPFYEIAPPSGALQ
ncbi:SMI1/KNR4 family protein [Streptomyces sp. NPDC001858]